MESAYLLEVGPELELREKLLNIFHMEKAK
jgi:hypothetical protein